MYAKGLRFLVGAVCLLCLAHSTSAADSARTEPEQSSNSSVPRYKLTVGQELIYEGTSHYSYGNNSEKENGLMR